MAELGDKSAIKPLITFFGKESSWLNLPIYNCIIETLKKLGATNEQIADAYLSLLEQPYIYHLKFFAQALEEIGDKRAINPLIRHLCTRSGFENFDEIVKILFNLGSTKEELADEYLKKLSVSTGWGSRYDAIVIMGKLEEKRAITPLIDLAPYLNINFVRDSQSDTEDTYNEFELAISTLEKLGATETQINEAYLNAVKNPDNIIRAEAYESLVSLRDNRAIEPLMQEGVEYDISGNNIFHNENIYFEALEKLGATKEQIIEMALKGLMGHSITTRHASLEKLVNLGTKNSTFHLIRAGLESGIFNDCRFGRVLFEALEKLEATKEQTIELALTGLMSSNTSIRLVSIDELVRLEAKESIGHLTPLLKDENEQVRKSASLALISLRMG